MQKNIIIIGGGVAGSEAGTLIGKNATHPIKITEIEVDPARKFGGWGFQGFPQSENTNLALRKMYLSDNESEILEWASNHENRKNWPEHLKNIEPHPDRIFPRALVKEYVTWRRQNVNNPHVTYESIKAEAIRVVPNHQNNNVSVCFSDGSMVTGDRAIIASGSNAVKVPDFLQSFRNHSRVIIDPLTLDGHKRRSNLSKNSKVLVLGTGLTGEEQLNILLKNGHTDITLLSRQGELHYVYPQNQKNKPLEIDHMPDFLLAETPEEFQTGLKAFYTLYTQQGHTPEDILAAMRPHWEGMRTELGGCVKAVERLRAFQRDLAVNSIGTSFEVAANTRNAENEDRLSFLSGYIREITDKNGRFEIKVSDKKDGVMTKTETFDHIINAIGRTIIRHPLWENLLSEGHANKHASIGVQVSETGQLLDSNSVPSELIYVVGMPRAGDHTFRHGFLGNTAFNVPQVRSHVAPTIHALLSRMDNKTNLENKTKYQYSPV